MKYINEYNAIVNKAKELDKAIRDKATAENIANMRNTLKTDVETLNATMYADVINGWKATKSINTCFNNLYVPVVTAAVDEVNGNVRYSCSLKLSRLSLAHYFRDVEPGKEIEFREIAKSTLATMQAARDVVLETEKADGVYSKVESALNKILAFIGYEKVSIRSKVKRVALSQFLQLSGTKAGNIREIDVTQWIDIFTRLIAINLNLAGKLEVNADNSGLKKIAESLNIELKTDATKK